tara:strand:- start:16891 stop:17139 length:249 start_codon:yes stop_codon:yes gene_type:complete
MEIIIAILSALLIAAGVAIRNLIRKNEILEDFIATQSEAIDKCNHRLTQIDDKGIFIADDEIGWFFNEVKKIQEALNEFRLR